MENRKTLQKRGRWISFIFILLLISSAVVAETFFMAKKSYLSWTFLQSSYWSAILEILLCWVLLLTGLWFFRKEHSTSIAFAFTVILTFCFLHQYSAALLAGCFYTLFICLLGSFICRVLHISSAKSWAVVFVMGIAGTLILIAGASLLRLGTPRKLRFIFAALLVVLLFLERSSVRIFFKKRFAQSDAVYQPLTLVQIALVSGIISFVLIQAGRANIALDYDSVWYGLRSEYMLAPKTGIYDAMPFLACVHTYSKGFETLTLPLSGVGSLGFIYIANIAFAVGIIKCIYDFSRNYCGKTLSLLAALCASAIPGIMNMAVTAKADLSTAFLQTVALCFLMDGMKKREWQPFVFCLSSCLLSYAFKPTSFVFTSFILLTCIILMLLLRHRLSYGSKGSFGFLAISVLALGVIWARTWYLTGYPFTFLLPGVLKSFGVSVRYPYEFYSVDMMTVTSLLSNRSLLFQRLLRMFYILFYPATPDTARIVIAWSGPVFIVLFALSIFLIFRRPSKIWRSIHRLEFEGILCVLFIVLSLLSFGCALLLSIPDGNYFMLLYIITIMLTVCLNSDAPFIKKPWPVLIVPVLAASLLITCASNWAWAVGFTPVEIKSNGFYDSTAWIEAYMDSNGLSEIYTQLKAEDKPRLEIISDKMQYTAFLPTTTDVWQQHRAYGNATTVTADAYFEYLQFADMKYLLLDADFMSDDSWTAEIMRGLAETGRVTTSLLNEHWALVKISPSSGSPDSALLDWFGTVSSIPESSQKLQ